MRSFARPFFASLVVIGFGALAGPSGFAAATSDTTFPAMPPAVNASSGANGGQAAVAAAPSIPLGTTITTANWRQYRQFMPDGMVTLFEGQSSWKMPDDIAMTIGPTMIHPLPAGYLAATEKYGPATKLVELPDGRLTISGYQGGIPFPNPTEPHRGWKLLADFWYRYMPHIVVNTPDNPGFECTLDGYADVNCTKGLWVARQLSFNTDPGTPSTFPGAAGKYYTTWFMLEEPEQQRYSTTLTMEYTDLTLPEDVYVFLPAMRRTQRLSAAARCSSSGTEMTPDDGRFAFDSTIPDFSAELVGTRKILNEMDVKSAGANFPADYDMPLGWPKPSWGQWELRDSYILDIRKLPAKASGYCYGKRILYIDQQFFGPLWTDLYDPKMQLWKVALLQPIVTDIPRIGPQNSTGAAFSHWWDLQSHHATFQGPNDGHGYNILVNDNVPASYLDLERYTTPGGLNAVMR
ncbi:MAG TPA: DUF1329 domain-containing protein [Candidatus Binataceae bacterium]|nr:DUF1329 domain-containing protein [Candidatus Binataceae bacterium]